MFAPYKSERYFPLLITIAVITLLLGISLIGSLHFHPDGLAHDDCPICLAYATIAISFIVFVALVEVLAFCCILVLSPFVSFYPKLFLSHKTPRSPPIFCLDSAFIKPSPGSGILNY
jgi:ATP/ADP translocase